MKKIFFIVFALAVTGLMFASCSGSKQNPNIPTSPNIDIASVTDNEPNESIFGAWHVVIDPESLDVVITESRESLNFNFTDYMSWCNGGCYQLKILYIEGDTIHLETKMINPVAISPYDVRVIYANLDGKEVLEPDGYTNLFDSPGGEPINPFYYYYPSADPERRFPGGPGSFIYRNIDVNITGYTSWEFDIIGACGFSHIRDVAEMLSFETTGTLTSNGGDMLVEAEFLDWQDDILQVTLMASVLEGSDVYLTYNGVTEKWECHLYNPLHQEAGLYEMLIFAYSPNVNSAAYLDYVTIEVDHEAGEEQFVTVDPHLNKVVIDWSDFEGIPYEYRTEWTSMFPYLCGDKGYVYSSTLNYIFGRANYLHEVGGETKTIWILGFFGGASNDGASAVYDWNNRIWVSKSYGSSIVQLTSSVLENDACISGDGSAMAYISYDNSFPQIAYRYFPNLTNEYYAGTPGDLYPADPVMSYDGSLIFCIAKTPTDTAYDLYKYTVATNIFDPVDITPDLEERTIQCNGNGTRLIFLRESAADSNKYNVFVFKDDVIDEFIQITNDAGGDIDYQHPDINEDGTMLLFNRWNSNTLNCTYYISDFDGSNKEIVKTSSLTLPMTFNAY